MQESTNIMTYPYLALHIRDHEEFINSSKDYSALDTALIRLVTNLKVKNANEVIVSSPFGLWREMIGDCRDYVRLPSGFTITIIQD